MNDLHVTKIAKIAKLAAAEHDDRASLLSDDEQMTWAFAHKFIQETLKSALLHDPDCAAELEAFSVLEQSDFMIFCSIMAFWLYNFMRIVDDAEAKVVLHKVYGLDESQQIEFKVQFSDRDSAFVTLNTFLSVTLNQQISLTAFMPHVIESCKQIVKLRAGIT
jgi:hypothetical protein